MHRFGVATYSQIDFWPLNTALYVIDFHGNHERFAYYFLKAFDFGGYNSGSAQPSLNRLILCIPFRCLSLHRRNSALLPAFLVRLTTRSRLNRRVNETLGGDRSGAVQVVVCRFRPRPRQSRGPRPRPSQANRGPFPGSPHRLRNSVRSQKAGRSDSLESTAELIRARANPFETPDRVFSHYSIPAFDNGQLPLAEVGINIKSMKFCVAIGTVLFSSKLNPTIERVWLVDPQPEESAICSTEFSRTSPQGPFRKVLSLLSIAIFKFPREAVNSHGDWDLKQSSACTSRRDLGDVDCLSTPWSCREIRRIWPGPVLARTLANRRQSQMLTKIRDALLPETYLRRTAGEKRRADCRRGGRMNGICVLMIGDIPSYIARNCGHCAGAFMPCGGSISLGRRRAAISIPNTAISTLSSRFDRDTPLHPFDTYFGLKEELEALFHRKVDLVELSAVRNPYLKARASSKAARTSMQRDARCYLWDVH